MNRLVTEQRKAGRVSANHELDASVASSFELDGQPYWLLTEEQCDEFVHAPGDFIAARCPCCGSPKVLLDCDLVRDARGDGGAPMILGAYWALCDECVHTWHRSHSPELVAALCKASLTASSPTTPTSSSSGDGVAAPTNEQGERR